ncbi:MULTISPECIES: iron-siderophore ABC transporter substrate-binding protein [unclassified Luteococcus]|uniref:iron-siderophore ABC transporter substrate-binding protein n=1 Tax=unclassified Luteococcus TaxID=2639923 RepID=UPI00313F3260
MTHLTRRSLIGLAGAAGLATLAGCGSQESTPASSASGSGAAAEGSFPVSIKHALGTATIKQAPTKIVTIGQGATEAAIALGTFPVGTETYTWGADKDGHLPWVREAYEKDGKELPKTFEGGEQLDVETIATLEPDLVLAPWSGLTQKQYDLLAEICPVVAYEKTAWTTTWDAEITTVAKALGKPDEGRKIVDGLKKTLADAGAEHPDWKGKTFSYIYTQGQGTLGVYLPTEQRVAMISALGLTPDPALADIKAKDGSDWALIGLENADKLSRSQLVFTWYLDAATKKQVLAQPLYAKIPAIKRGSVVAPEDQQLVTAMSMINPLTVPWVLPKMTPLIDAAVKKIDA